MALLDELVGTPEEEPADPRAPKLVGPAVLRPEQLRAMERALERELPSYAARRRQRERDEAATAPFPPPPPPPAPVDPAPAASAPAPLPIWVPPTFEPVEPLPVWTPPAVAAPSAGPGSALEPCPNCGEELEVSRIDLTANASWLTCHACGLRWGGTIERQDPDPAPLALPTGTGERGHVAAG